MQTYQISQVFFRYRARWRIGHNGAVLAAVCFALGCASSPQSAPTRPAAPRFEIPSDPQLLGEIEAAVDLRRREDFDRFLDARDPGELIEHATLTQVALDRGVFGPAAIFVFGDELFDYEFRPEQGLGNDLANRPGIDAGPNRAPNLRRVHQGELGGPDSYGCSTCHSRGGLDGAGTSTQNAFLRSDGDRTLVADVRNAPHVLGLGPVEALAREMTAAMHRIRDATVAAARAAGAPREARLEAKGVAFGILGAASDGALDLTRVEGVDADLVVKPFGWKGHQATLRSMTEESFRIHVGIVSLGEHERVNDGLAERRSYGDGSRHDIDRDGHTFEIDDGMLTSVAAYLAQLEVPVVRPPTDPELLDAFGRGQRLFEASGCAHCHRPSLELEDAVLELRPTQKEHASKGPLVIDLIRDGEHPKAEPTRALGTIFNVRLFSDLKRHDLGERLATPAAQNGIPPAVFLTRPLWGLAFTAPYLHDGRAPTVDDAIRWHGGEAQAARDAYVSLSAADRGAVGVFLLSLTREPKLMAP